MAWAITGLPNSATAPIIGKAFFAASLKNSLLLWASFLLFSIVFLPGYIPFGSSGMTVICLRCEITYTIHCINGLFVITIYGFVIIIIVSFLC
jgi:hypothetical protein